MQKDGYKLAKVLKYYGLIDSYESTQKIVCPFHNDVNPSMIVDLVKGRFFCFGCNASGDALRFVKKMNPKLNDLQACKKLQEILNSKKSEVKKEYFRVRKRKPQKELMDIAKDYYFGLSKVDWENDEQNEVVESRKYMCDRGFNAKTLTNCKAKVTYNKAYPIIFPMFDNKEFKGWVCRTNDKEVEKKRKYLYNEGFSRATTLCGNYDVKSPIFIVEGYMDRLKLKQYGVRNVVAILGWKMSNEQIMKLKNLGVTHVISALDNDECGKKGTDFLRKHFKVTRFAYLKGIKDPGEMDEKMFKKMYNRTKQKWKKERKK